jgi:hypothetical protein
MAIKTFNPNRTVGGSFQLVRDASGNYSIKEVGFEQLGSLPLPDLADSAVTTSTTKTDTAADITDTTIEDQTKKAFELPKPGDDRTQADRDADIFQRATDLSSNLQGVNVDKGRGSVIDQMYRSGNRFDADTFDDAVGIASTKIEDPTERVFKDTEVRDESNLSGYGAQIDNLGLKDPKIKTTTFKKSRIRGPRDFKDMQRSEVTRAGDPDPDTQDPMLIDAQSQTLGVKADPSAVELGEMKTTAPFPGRSRTIGGLKVEAPAPLAIDEGAVQLGEMNTTTAKKTFSESINTALKGFKTPMMALVEGVANIGVSPAQQRLNSLNKSALASAGYKTRGELGSSVDPGRIAGNPADNVFAGMNAQSARGNIMTASRNRIDTIRNSAAKARSKGDIAKAERMEAKANKFEGQRSELLAEQEKKQAEINKATMNKGPPGQDDRNAGGKIVCTMMNESYGFGSFRNKIWMKFHKDLSPEYQRGYHRLFLPLVKIAKTNKIIKNILEHIAVHSTIDMRQSMRGKKHLLGRIYRKILLPICYWAGKK